MFDSLQQNLSFHNATTGHDLPLIADNFAGGGGASTGIEQALGRSPDLAINHDATALSMHAANHPETTHLINNIWSVDPRELVRPGQRVGLAWFSPDCKHHSKAKGGKPVEQGIRDLAWVVVDWAHLTQSSFGGMLASQQGKCSVVRIGVLPTLRRSKPRPKSAVFPILNLRSEIMVGRMEPRKRTAPCSVRHVAVTPTLCVRPPEIGVSGGRFNRTLRRPLMSENPKTCVDILKTLDDVQIDLHYTLGCLDALSLLADSTPTLTANNRTSRQFYSLIAASERLSEASYSSIEEVHLWLKRRNSDKEASTNA